MPARPNLGYAAAMGVEGGYEALHALIARRQKQEEEAQLLRLRDQAAALAERKLEEDTKYRQSVQEQNTIEREQLQQYRTDVLKKQQDTEARQLENQQIDNWRASFDNTPGGQIFDEAGYQKGVKAGYGPLFKPIPGTHPLEPVRYEFQGGAAWRKGEEDRISREEQRALDRQNALAMQQASLANARAISELAKAGQDEKGWTWKEDDSPEGASWYKPGRPRRPLEPGTLAGAAAARASKAAEEIVPFVSSLRKLKEVGKAYNWEGTGPTSTWQAGLTAMGLHTPTEGATKVRAALGDARSLIAHQRYGAALTEGEKEILNTFVSTIDTQGVVTEAMIDQVLQVELDLMRDVGRGARKLYEEMRPTPKAPTPDIASIRPYLPSMTPGARPAPTTGGGGLKIVGMK
jgi:hypothetical protein